MKDLQRSPTVVLIVMDGFGCNPKPEANAVEQAHTPVLDRLNRHYPHGTLRASGEAVGLPRGQMGNSEVGHLNLGAGRVVFQDFTRITRAIESGAFFENPALIRACRHVKERGSTLHLMGLIGYGGVHAYQPHLLALLELAQRQHVERLAIHAFTDGRDTLPHDGLAAMRELEAALCSRSQGGVATVSGRYYAMDRDRRWDRTELAYAAMTRGEGLGAASGSEAIEVAYADGLTDEFIRPTVVRRAGRPVALVQNHDAVIFFNYRTDRPRQLCRAFVQPDFDGFDRGPALTDLSFVTMTAYEKTLDTDVAFAGVDVTTPLARVISDHGLTQLHVAETEKYAHVTFFFNGGREEPFPGEDRILVPSPRHVGTYDKKPEMSADEITGRTIQAMADQDYAFVLINFANPDMVGHTGDLQATIKAVETVDRNVGRIIDAITNAAATSATSSNGSVVIITADHGNAEQMVDEATGGPFTSHTIDFPVPCTIVPIRCPQFNRCAVRPGGSLADVAPTVLDLLALPIPEEMEGQSLLRCV